MLIKSTERTLPSETTPSLAITCQNPHTQPTIISTTPIPKCSFHMVCSPTLALPSHALRSSKLQFTTNSTRFSTPSSTASPCVFFSTARSPSLRQLPKITSRTSSKEEGWLLLLLGTLVKAARARTCNA